ncbi:hypothetical protein GIB67_030755 [Kingdonia uniflora]|uniref:Poor homologous synapsis 1 PH domain-containing protein n=1 Tax=Kingdonia uniflora TaxID=39325 RepID=A0A7J7L2Y3_9MAGN|nr:hypothetical protein GIB67_030755 [Kingdonia uniflora]
MLVSAPAPKDAMRNVTTRKVVEEHFTCNLHFSWPQVSCVTQCPTRGSRVIFTSSRDSDGQIQKFALRFASACDAQSFIDTIRMKPIPLAIEHQDISKDAMGCSRPNSGVGHEVSSQSDFGSSNAVQYRDQLSFMDLVEDYSPQTISPLMSYNSEQKPCSQESFPEGLPPSFTALLTNCCAEVEKGGAVPGEIDLKTQIIKYMSDASFHDMLAKVEEVMLEIGGDLAL